MIEDKGKLYMCTVVKKCSRQSTAPVSQRSWVQIPYRPEFFFQVLFQVVFIAYILFFMAVHIYDFHISTIIIHHLDGLFGPNIMTSSQLVCQLSWQSSASVLQRSWVQIPYKPEFFFFRSYFNYQFSSVHSCEVQLCSDLFFKLSNLTELEAT